MNIAKSAAIDSLRETSGDEIALDQSANAGALPRAQEDTLWARVISRDRTADSVFVYAVTSTGIYCRPTCPSRRPRRANVRFFADALNAERRGFRACRRCQPNVALDDQSEAIRRIREYIETHLDQDLSLIALGRVAYLSPTHLQRIFKRVIGVTPREYVQALRRERLKLRLREGATVTSALYEAGFQSSSSVYEQVPAHLGMTPSAYRRGGEGVTISYTTAACPLGRLLVAATERGLCAVYFGESDAELAGALEREYPAARRVEGGDELRGYVAAILSALNGLDELDGALSGAALSQLPLDIAGTPFQRRVWQALRAIPSGQTRSYAEVARIIGHPTATRAVARACASNPVALVIPCHRVRRSDGSLTGYRWGPGRKRALLLFEGSLSADE